MALFLYFYGQNEVNFKAIMRDITNGLGAVSWLPIAQTKRVYHPVIS